MDYCEEILREVPDLHNDYRNMICTNYNRFIKMKVDQGISLYRLRDNLVDPREMAQRYTCYSQLYMIYGKKSLKHVPKRIKEVIEKGYLSKNLYRTKMNVFIFKATLLLFFGIAFIVASAAFIIGSIGNLSPVVIFFSLFVMGAGAMLIQQVFDSRYRVYNDLIDNAMTGCKINSFEKE